MFDSVHVKWVELWNRWTITVWVTSLSTKQSGIGYSIRVASQRTLDIGIYNLVPIHRDPTLTPIS
jgi:hypothetical protein